MNKMEATKEQYSFKGYGDLSIRCVCELLGTGLLVIWSCMMCLPGWGAPWGPPSLLVISLGTGLTVMTIIQAFGHISGAHINPSVTWASMILGTLSFPMAVAYWSTQLMGGIIGYGLFLVATPLSAMGNSNSTCVTLPHQNLSSGQAIFVEALLTFVLIIVTGSVWDPKNAQNTDSVPLKFGFVVTVINLVAAPYTGASMNPARSLGPALWNNYWERHWIYWVGPLLGASIGAILYRFVLLRGLYSITRTKSNAG